MPITTSLDEFCVRATAVAQLKKANEKNDRLMKTLINTHNQLSASRRLSEELMNCLSTAQETIVKYTKDERSYWEYEISIPGRDWTECDTIEHFAHYYDDEVATLCNTMKDTATPSPLYSMITDMMFGIVRYFRKDATGLPIKSSFHYPFPVPKKYKDKK